MSSTSQQYSSEILYHFVGSGSPDDDEENFVVLNKILRSQQIGRNLVPCQIVVDYDRQIEKGELIVQSVICLCDIRLGQLRHVHLKKYGRFGVGVDKITFARQGGRPVIYMPIDRQPGGGANNLLGKNILSTYRALSEYFLAEAPSTRSRFSSEYPSSPVDAVEQARTHLAKDLLAFLKYYDPTLPDHHEDNYYMEREWRKFGNFSLHLALRQVVAPIEYHARLRDEFPQIDVKLVVPVS